MTAQTPVSTQPVRLTGVQVLVNGVLAIAVAVIANIVTRFILGLVVAIPSNFPPMMSLPIVFFTTLYGVIATMIYLVINRVAGNPQRVWLIVVIIGFVLASLPNLALAANPAAAPFSGGTAQLYLLLLVYHVVALLIYFFLIPRRR